MTRIQYASSEEILRLAGDDAPFPQLVAIHSKDAPTLPVFGIQPNKNDFHHVFAYIFKDRRAGVRAIRREVDPYKSLTDYGSIIFTPNAWDKPW